MSESFDENNELSLIKRKVSWKAYVATLFIVSVIFAYSVTIRVPYFGSLPPTMGGFQAYIDPPIVNNFKEWLENSREGRPNNYILHVFPRSFESPNDVLRGREVAYFPLFYMPAYLVVAALNLEPSLEALQVYSLVYQFLLTLFAAYLVVFILSRIVHPLIAVLCAIPAILLHCLLPGPMYYFLFTCLPDINVLPLCVLAVILEMRIDAAEGSKVGWRAAQCIVLFLGMLMEWLFGPLAVALVVKRFCLGQLGTGKWEITKKAFLCFLPAGLGLLTLLIYCITNDGLVEIGMKFLEHSSISDRGFAQYLHHTLASKFPTALGSFALYLLPLCVSFSLISFGAIAFIKKSRREMSKTLQDATLIVSSVFLLVAACSIHLLILTQHYDENGFSPLVFLAPLTTFYCAFPILLLFIAIAKFSKANERARMKFFHPINAAHALIACVLIAVSVVWLAKSPGQNNELRLSTTDFFEKFGTTVASLPLEGDVLFSSVVSSSCYALGCVAFVDRMVWPTTTNDEFNFEDFIKLLLSGKPLYTVIDGTVVPDFLRRPGFFPNLPEDTWRVPDKFTVGIVLDPDKPVDPKVAPLVAVAEKDLRIGPFRNLVVPSDALRKLYPPEDQNNPTDQK
jgi:uncharacterized membrane protein YidH (DUF202 family)